MAGALLNAAANLASTLFAAVPCAVGDILVAAPSHHNTEMSICTEATAVFIALPTTFSACSVPYTMRCNILSRPDQLHST